MYLPHFEELVPFSFVTASISKVYDLLRLFLSFPLAFSPSCVSSSVLFQRKPGQGHQHLLTLGNLGPSWLSGLWAEHKEAAFLQQGRLVVSRLPKQQAAQAADWVQDLSDFAWHSLDLIRNPVFNYGTFIQDTDKLDKVQRGALRWLVTICKQ